MIHKYRGVLQLLRVMDGGVFVKNQALVKGFQYLIDFCS